MSKAQAYREKSFCSGNTGIDENHYKTRPLEKNEINGKVLFGF